MFKTRLISGVVLVLLFIGILYCGGIVTCASALFLSLVGAFELLRIYKLSDKMMGYVVYVFITAYYALLYFDLREYVLPLMLATVLMVLALYVFTYPTYEDKDAMASVLAFFYVGVMMSYLYLVRDMEKGGALVVMVFVCSWVNDTCAYCVGVTMGKHKMSPKLSPKKSVEGLVGGICGSAIVGALYGIFFDSRVYELSNAPLIFAVMGALGAIVAVIGDLSASAIKRNNEIKDYGKLIPGHGGILDRFDSIIFTAPIVYYCIYYMIGSLA